MAAVPPLPSVPQTGGGSQGTSSRTVSIRTEFNKSSALYRTTSGMAFPARSHGPASSSSVEVREWAKQSKNRRTQAFSRQFFTMYEDTGLGSLHRKDQRKEQHKIYMAQKAAEREARILELELLEEEKRETRRALREERRRMAQRENAAAGTIQRMFRCHAARQRVGRRRMQRIHENAAVIQKAWRDRERMKTARAEVRRRLEHQQMATAAEAIQDQYRKSRARAEARQVLEMKRKERDERRARLVEQRQSRSATKVQAQYRGFHGRRRAKDYANKRKQHMLLVKQEERLRQKVEDQLRKKESERQSKKEGQDGGAGARRRARSRDNRESKRSPKGSTVMPDIA